MNASSVLHPGQATACGSLPHTDLDAAVALVLDALPSLPAMPSLPNRDPVEGMLGQVAWGMAGVVVGPDGRLEVDPDLVDPDGRIDANGVDDDGLPIEAFRSAVAFLDALAAGRHRGAVKLQLAGPVTLGTALVRAGAAPRRAFPAAGAVVRARARALIAATRRRLPDVDMVLVLDEPSLGAASLGDGAVGVEESVDLVSGALASVEASTVTGLHCCGVADWGSVLRSGPQLLSLPVDIATSLRAADIGPFLERGGWVAWGAVPTGGPLGGVDGGGMPRLWRNLAARWHSLADGGVDPVLLRRRALVTPACGLAHHDERQAALALRLTALLGSRVAAGTAAPASRRSL